LLELYGSNRRKHLKERINSLVNPNVAVSKALGQAGPLNVREVTEILHEYGFRSMTLARSENPKLF
jgi:hypothetical protein